MGLHSANPDVQVTRDGDIDFSVEGAEVSVDGLYVRLFRERRPHASPKKWFHKANQYGNPGFGSS